jgi:hypothetical protein
MLAVVGMHGDTTSVSKPQAQSPVTSSLGSELISQQRLMGQVLVQDMITSCQTRERAYSNVLNSYTHPCPRAAEQPEAHMLTDSSHATVTLRLCCTAASGRHTRRCPGQSCCAQAALQ